MFEVVVLLVLGGWQVQGDTYPRAAHVDAIHYRIQVELKEGSEEISGVTEILFAAKAEGVKSVTLDFAGLTVEQVRDNDAAAVFNHAEGRLSVTLAREYRRGERFTVAVRYSGKPSDGLFIKKNKFGDAAVFADNWPNRAHFWFPSIDHPYDKATVEFLVTAPVKYDVVSNGRLMEMRSLQNGAKLSHWRTDVPIPTYCMVIGAAEFSVLNIGSWNGTELSYFLFPKDRDNGIRDHGRALQMIEMYSNLIGQFPYEKLAMVQSSTRFGGMENSSAIFYSERAYNGSGRLEGTTAHETAHQWFGDSVTEADWHHLWLSEGFATYFGHLFFERADGRDRFVQMMLADKESYLRQYSKDPRPVIDESITDLFKLLNANNYQKGGWVLHMLRRLMGDPKFFAGIRDYYRTYRDGTALTEDLQRVMEFHYGKPLGWFFRQWLYEPGYPVVEAEWAWSESAKELRLRVRQTQSWTLFRMPLDIEIKSGARIQREVIEASEREQSFAFKLDAKPSGVSIDPGEWVLKVLTLKEAGSLN